MSKSFEKKLSFICDACTQKKQCLHLSIVSKERETRDEDAHWTRTKIRLTAITECKPETKKKRYDSFTQQRN